MLPAPLPLLLQPPQLIRHSLPALQLRRQLRLQAHGCSLQLSYDPISSGDMLRQLRRCLLLQRLHLICMCALQLDGLVLWQCAAAGGTISSMQPVGLKGSACTCVLPEAMQPAS
jgi:hypothetical protein